MPPIVSNAELQNVANQFRDRYNIDAVLRLYKNDYTPTLAVVIGNVVECDYSGYAEVNTAGDWEAVQKDQDGKWSSMSANYIFSHSGGGVDNTVYGWYLVSGTSLLLIQRFDTPIQMENGSLPFSLQLDREAEDQSVS